MMEKSTTTRELFSRIRAVLKTKKASLSYFHGFMPLENGVLNCRTKEFLPFSPEYVFDECTYGGVYAEGEDGPSCGLRPASPYNRTGNATSFRPLSLT